MKSLNELADELKNLILDLQSDAHNKANIRPERYNNLKLTMEPRRNRNPHIIVSMSMSLAEFDLKSFEKTSGSLGPDEKYVLRWLGKSNTMASLQECWKNAMETGDADTQKSRKHYGNE